MNSTGLALNVFNEEGNWHFTIYNDTDEGVRTNEYLSITPSADQLERYLALSGDDDWWTYDDSPEFSYILRGKTNG